MSGTLRAIWPFVPDQFANPQIRMSGIGSCHISLPTAKFRASDERVTGEQVVVASSYPRDKITPATWNDS